MRIPAITLMQGAIFNPKISGLNAPYQTKPMGMDTVSFEARSKKLLDAKQGAEAAEKLRTSTSGYRSTFGEDFNDRLVYTITQAAIAYAKEKGADTVMIGGDTRKATEKYAPIITELFLEQGINVQIPMLEDAKHRKHAPVATPALAVSTMQAKLPITILLTASHNPWDEGGYNFLTDEGAVADCSVINKLVETIKRITGKGRIDKRYKGERGKVSTFNPYEIYTKHVKENKLIDFANIAKANIGIYYEDFGGTGGYYLPQLMEENGVKLGGVLHSKTKGPEPNNENALNLKETVKKSENPLKIGIMTDGDSDRFGVVDENGNFISAVDVIMLASYHLIKNKGMKQGTIIKNCATSDRIRALASYFNSQEGYSIDVEDTPVGFKYLGGKMLELEHTSKPAILAGEESGGFTIRGHIPEKDGFIAVSTVLDLVATEGKPVGEILKEIKEKTGTQEQKSETLGISFEKTKEGYEKQNKAIKGFEKYLDGSQDKLQGFEIDKERTKGYYDNMCKYKENGDGLKIYLKDGSYALIRKSGTEPKLRIYIETINQEVYDALSKNLLEEAKLYANS